MRGYRDITNDVGRHDVHARRWRVGSTEHGREARDAEATSGDLTFAYARGMANGNAAAITDCPDELDRQTPDAVVAMVYQAASRAQTLITTALAAWEAASEWTRVRSVAEQEEYCVGWVHGYFVRAEELEGVPVIWTDGAEGNDPSSPITAGTP